MIVEPLQGAVTEQAGHRSLEPLQALIGGGEHSGSIMVVVTNQVSPR